MIARPALAIVGMRRSGTSSICQALHLLGVSFGAEERLFQGDSFNEEGYWEHRALIGLHRSFRMSLNLASVDCDPMPEDWRDRPASNHFLEAGVRCLQEHFMKLPGPWAWKDPDASLALPFVYEVGERASFVPHVLVCVRNPLDTARSEARRKGAPELETLGAWLAHTLAALQGSASRPRTVLLFSDFLHDPRRALSPVVRVLELSPSEEEWRGAVASVRQDLVHHEADVEALETLPPLVKSVYELCRRLAANPDSAAEEEIESCAREFESYRRMFSRPPLEEASLGALWQRQGGSQYAQTSYRPSGGWQTVTLETGAAPASQVQLFLYPLPANVWIRKAAWRYGIHVTEAALEPGRSGNLQRQFGLTCVGLIHGPDHVVVKTPLAKGPFTLELEFLIESNNLVTGQTYKVLSDLCRQTDVKS